MSVAPVASSLQGRVEVDYLPVISAVAWLIYGNYANVHNEK